MNKHLLTLAGLLSLLVVNQAFGWPLRVKNETGLKLWIHVNWDGGGDTFRLERQISKEINRNFNNVAVDTVKDNHYRGERLAEFYLRKDSNGAPIQPLKGLTIKTVNGKTVIVENQ